MQPVVNFINQIGNIGGLIGLGWAAWGAWDLAIGIRRELDDKKDKGIQSVILGALLGVVLKHSFQPLPQDCPLSGKRRRGNNGPIHTQSVNDEPQGL